jgi:hypothetical protein
VHKEANQLAGRLSSHNPLDSFKTTSSIMLIKMYRELIEYKLQERERERERNALSFQTKKKVDCTVILSMIIYS